MKDETFERRRTLLWALPASLILHVLIAALLIYRLPMPPEQPQEEPVNVALVPPPELPKKPEVKKPPEPKVEKPPERKVEKPESQELPPIPVLKPVFQFGDKDTGPRKSLEGGSAQDNAPSPGKADDTKPAAVPKDAESKPASAPDAGGSTEPAKIDEKPGADKQEAEASDADKQASAATMPLAVPGDDGEIDLPTSAQAPKPRPDSTPKPTPAKVSKSGSGSASRPSSTNVAAARAYSGLPGVRRLYSQGASGDAFATTAIDGLPRDERAGQLCFSVLGQELEGGSYDPYAWPLYVLKEGNVIAQPHAHFLTRTKTWYDLSFRCEIDANATRVVSFAFRVGAPNSPEESARLELQIRR
ncbi:DUF930 domain-containing protein [Mesorhizobium sp. 128a]